jgi:hypothetical protein
MKFLSMLLTNYSTETGNYIIPFLFFIHASLMCTFYRIVKMILLKISIIIDNNLNIKWIALSRR